MNKLRSTLFVAVEAFLLCLTIFSFIYLNNINPEESTYILYGKVQYPYVQDYEPYREKVLSELREKNPDYTSLMISKSEARTSSSEHEGNGGLLTSVSQGINNLESKIEKYTSRRSYLERLFVSIRKKIEKWNGISMTISQTGGQNSDTDVMDVVVTTEEGQLGWVQDDIDLTEQLENLVDFGLRMKEENRNFVLVENPNKFASSPGFTDYSEEKYDEIHEAWEAFGLDRIDCTERMKEAGMTEKDIFYDTDFHWKPSSGILADSYLAEYLNNNCGYNIDTSVFDLKSYEVKVLPDAFLGYLGKKVTLEYAEADDFEIWYPSYDTDYTVWDSFFQMERKGSLSETLFWEDRLNIDSVYDGNMYEFYGYSDQALITVHNNKLNDNSKLMVVKTSFANCMTPYLASVVEDLTIVDLRLFSGSLEALIDEVDPDTVVLVYGLSSFTSEYTKGYLFDFR